MSYRKEKAVNWEKAMSYLGEGHETLPSLLASADSVCFNEVLPKMYDSLLYKAGVRSQNSLRDCVTYAGT